MIELPQRILELRLPERIVLPENRECLLPLMRKERIKRLIVERRDHLRDGLLRIGPGDHRGPRLLLRGLHFGSEMLPLHRELLVAPRHVHVARSEVGAVLTHHRDVQREAAAHPLGYFLFHLLLREAEFRPETLEHLSAVLDLDERPARVVARAPERHEFIARLQRPLRRGDEVRDFHGEALVVELQHLHVQLRRHLFAEAILRLQHRTVRPCTELERQRPLARAVRRERALHRDRAEFP